MCPWLVDEELGRSFRARTDRAFRAMDTTGYAGRLPGSQTVSRMEFLEAAHRRLAYGMANPAMPPLARAWAAELERSGSPPYVFDDARRATWLGRAGLRDVAPGKRIALAPHHLYACSQGWAADPSQWDNPAAGIVHSAVQLAFAAELRWAGGKDEPALTDALLKGIGAEAAELLKAIEDSPTDLPPDTFLHFLTANMQTSRDELDSDLAIVVGLRIGGKSIYRVCLLQAKWRPGCGGKIGARKGRQLEGLLATGMGYYLFYPGSGRSNYDDFRFASVVPAEAVFHDVWGAGGRPSYRNVDTLGSQYARAWDLPTFVSRLLDPTTFGAGRSFGTVEAAADALRGERDLPLAPRRLFAVDTTGNDLLVATLESMYDPGPDGPGPDKPRPDIATGRLKPPARRDLDGDPETGPEPPDAEREFRRRGGWNPFGET